MKIKRPNKYNYWTGGGFSNKELKIMDDKGVSFFGLGNRRLRAETAAINSIILLNKMADL